MKLEYKAPYDLGMRSPADQEEFTLILGSSCNLTNLPVY